MTNEIKNVDPVIEKLFSDEELKEGLTLLVYDIWSVHINNFLNNCDVITNKNGGDEIDITYIPKNYLNNIITQINSSFYCHLSKTEQFNRKKEVDKIIKFLKNNMSEIILKGVEEIKKKSDKIDDKEKLYKTTNNVKNKVFVFTGKFKNMTRDRAKELVIFKGGIFRNRVSSKTNYLVYGENPGNQKIIDCINVKIKFKVNIKRISESEFYKMMDE